MDELDAKIGMIRAVFPGVISEVTLHDGGEDFLVVEVNHEWMFRFPRNEAARGALAVEKRFLPRFKPVSPLAVPDFEYDGDGFAGYRRIGGTLFTADLFQALPGETRDRVAVQIGQFLSALHSLPLEEALAIGLTEGWGGWRQKAYRRFRDDVLPLLSTAAAAGALACLEEFFALEWKRVVVHGDFYLSDHVFFDESRQELSGVIDFGDLTIEDAACDFLNIVEEYGELFFQTITAHYCGEESGSLRQRVRVRLAAYPLFDAIYSLEYGFAERFNRRVAAIESAFGGPADARCSPCTGGAL